MRRVIGYLENSRAELSRDESKLTYSAVLIEPYREYVDLLFRQNRPEDALMVADSAKD